MASVAELMVDPLEFEEDVKRIGNLAEATRHLYFIAARRIQVNDSCSKLARRIEKFSHPMGKSQIRSFFFFFYQFFDKDPLQHARR